MARTELQIHADAVRGLIDAAALLRADAPTKSELQAIIDQGEFRPTENEAIAYWFARFLTIRESLKSMTQTDWGRVMVISSIAGLRGLKGGPAYSASKHAVNGLIKSLAADFAKKPITFNSICPAYVETPIIDQNIESIMARTGCTEEEARHMMVGVNPHGRLITPEEVARQTRSVTGRYLAAALKESLVSEA